jgi:hypothetical protein
MNRSLLVFLVCLCLTPLARADDTPRTKVKLLCGFEGDEAARLMKFSENLELVTVNDNGVTEGKNCARLTIPKGPDFGSLSLTGDMVRDWADYDYFAVDLYTEDEHRYPITLELWDDLSKNYQTRCTFEGGAVTRPGRQTLMFQINRAKRNSKEGRDWDELQPQDKIKMNGLTRVKLFTSALKDHDAVFWIDNIRLLQEDAAKPKLKVDLPPGAVAYHFGTAGATAPGFKQVTAQTGFKEGKDAGFVATKGLTAGGEGWPDLLSGTFVAAPDGETMEFRAPLPNGDYRLWLAAGPVIRPGMDKRHFLLKVNDTTIVDDTPSFDEFNSEKYLFRFLHTQYSEKPHALWTNYIDRMYPTHTSTITVKDGTLTIKASNHFLSAVVVLPAGDKESFDRFTTAVKGKRIEAFEATYYTPKREKPKPVGAEPFVVFVPDLATTVRPWTGPSAEERKRPSIQAAAAPGQRVVMRLAVTPFADLGKCSLVPGDLKGPGTIAAKQVKGHFQNYRFDGSDVHEMVLLPSLTPEIEVGVSQCFWLWLTVPADAAPGLYKGAVSFQPGVGKAVEVPVELEVYPFTLDQDLPVSYGMYYGPPSFPRFAEADRRRLLKEQLTWMRQIGFTAVPVGAPEVVGLTGGNKVQLRFDPTMYELAKEVGMGKNPEQAMMGAALPMARAIGRRLTEGGAKVDQQPGIELRQPGFKDYFLDACRQYRDFIDKSGVAVAVEIVDEPRETPNPWNRNLADAITYGDYLKEAGLRSFITPMGDSNSGKDYTSLVDHTDILSTHAWKGSAKLMKKTRETKKTLWLYNTGMDRFSWGFYAARVGSVGRWEWHFCFAEDNAKGGYPGRDWYNPFTGLHGLAPQAPFSYPGGMLYQSAYLDVSEGINDYAYLFTLRKAIAANQKAGTNEKKVAEARAFLEALDRVIPELPELKGIVKEGDGALVGMGVQDEARLQAEAWRRTIAGFLKELKK